MMTERQGIEIDYCPKCRGVWLDRGELDKLIDGGSPVREEIRQPPLRESRPDSYQQPKYKEDDDYYYKKKKKDSFHNS